MSEEQRCHAKTNELERIITVLIGLLLFDWFITGDGCSVTALKRSRLSPNQSIQANAKAQLPGNRLETSPVKTAASNEATNTRSKEKKKFFQKRMVTAMVGAKRKEKKIIQLY